MFVYAVPVSIDDVTTAGCRAQVVFDVDPVLAARLADCQFTFVQKPTAEGEQDVSGDDGENGGGEGGNGGTTPDPNEGGENEE